MHFTEPYIQIRPGIEWMWIKRYCNYSWKFFQLKLVGFLYLFFAKKVLMRLKTQNSDAILRVIGYF